MVQRLGGEVATLSYDSDFRAALGQPIESRNQQGLAHAPAASRGVNP
jgi:hypothetical protein